MELRRILYEDNHLLIINKPAGYLVQGDRTGDQTLNDILKAYIKEKYEKPGEVFLTPVHRLDRPVSGCLIFARTSKALSRMTELFRNNEVNKVYLAVSKKLSPKDNAKLRDFIVKDHDSNKSKTVKEGKAGGKECILTYALVSALPDSYLYRIKPQTGRSHQIRVQMAAIGCPITGDTKYGDKLRSEEHAIGLHCYQTSFLHPVKKTNLYVECLPDADSIWRPHISLIKSGDIDG